MISTGKRAFCMGLGFVWPTNNNSGSTSNRPVLKIFSSKRGPNLFSSSLLQISQSAASLQSCSWFCHHKLKGREITREMVLTHLPRLRLSIFTHPPAPLYAPLDFNLVPRLKLPTIVRPKSSLSTTEPVPISHISSNAHEFLASPEENQIQISLDKLFVPPETEVSLNDASLSTRILKGSNIVLSKYARDAQVVQAEFVKSSVRTEDCPADGLPEFALVGRSNVGKSSLLNSLVRRKRLALTSKKPGMSISHCFLLTVSVLLMWSYGKLQWWY